MKKNTLLIEKVRTDYEKNFMPRKEIKLRLTFDEMKALLSDEEFHSESRIAWHFLFYLKQLFMLSLLDIQNTIPFGLIGNQKAERLKEMSDLVTYSEHDTARALVAFMRIEWYKEGISDLELHDMFSGHNIYDDYCAQVAYFEYNRRKKK